MIFTDALNIGRQEVHPIVTIAMVLKEKNGAADLKREEKKKSGEEYAKSFSLQTVDN